MRRDRVRRFTTLRLPRIEMLSYMRRRQQLQELVPIIRLTYLILPMAAIKTGAFHYAADQHCI